MYFKSWVLLAGLTIGRKINISWVEISIDWSDVSSGSVQNIYLKYIYYRLTYSGYHRPHSFVVAYLLIMGVNVWANDASKAEKFEWFCYNFRYFFRVLLWYHCLNFSCQNFIIKIDNTNDAIIIWHQNIWPTIYNYLSFWL